MKPQRGERGFALLIVVSMLAILAFLAIAITREARLRKATLVNNSDLLVARNLAEAAIEMARLELTRPSDEAQFQRDGATHVFRLEGGEARFAIEDERGKLDLNRQPREVLAALIARVAHEQGVPVSAGPLADRIKASAPNNVGDIARLPGVTPELFAALTPHVTVYSESTRVNIDDATLDTLTSLPGVTAGLAEQVRQARRDGTARPSLGAAETYATTQSGPVYTVIAIGKAPSGIEARVTETAIATPRDIGARRYSVRVIERR